MCLSHSVLTKYLLAVLKFWLNIAQYLCEADFHIVCIIQFEYCFFLSYSLSGKN